MKDAKTLLKQLSDIIPPGTNQHHNLTIDDETGNLVLCFMLGSTFYPVILDDNDLEKPIQELIGEIELKVIKQITQVV